jgi:S1-C subfamily serine protease
MYTARLRRIGIMSLAALAILIMACTPSYKEYIRKTQKPIDEYYKYAPTRPYEEVRRISVTFKEWGIFTGKGSEEMIIDMLKDKAAKLNADAIMDIRIVTERIPGEVNLLWYASALAIRYTGTSPRYVDTPKDSKIPTDLKSSGTGFFISRDGYLITAAHVIENAVRITVRTLQGDLIEAKVVGSDPINDIAVLKVPGEHFALSIKSSRSIKLGSIVMTLGFPNIQVQGLSPKLTRGEISSTAGINDDPRHFQISVPVQPGNSGGALVDKEGFVVGVVISKLGDIAALRATGSIPQNVNYAVKSDYVLAFLNTLRPLEDQLLQEENKATKLEEVIERLEKATVLVMVQ